MELKSQDTSLVTNKGSHYLKFKLDKQIIFLELSTIYIVLPILELQMLPNKDPAFAGILNYHGNPISIYHFYHLVHAPKIDYDLNAAIIICTTKTGLVGLLTSEIFDVLLVRDTKIKRPDKHILMPYVIGLFEDESESAWVLDVELMFEIHQSEIESYK